MYYAQPYSCPFFRWDEKKKLHCEAGCAVFPSVGALKEYSGAYCANVPGWRKCTLAAHLESLYERGE